MPGQPDLEFAPEGFAASWWAYRHRHDAFEDHLLCAGDEGFDFTGTRTDDYDLSVEVDGVPSGARLNEAQHRLLAACGFLTAFVNHKDGVETHYNLRGEPTQGWRRKRTDNGFVISRRPEGWTGKTCDEWFENGYMKVDPNL